MSSAAQALHNAPVFEVPDPIDEFGQDGGKFYRCYDALADEIDEDMVKGLKEQLDGILIFAGIFAGVNSAFLAITLPLLSADPSDDISALLAQNNAILIQMATGRNDSIPTNPSLPSAGFSPARDVFAVNALFSLSLSFAIISSFLAVLGRQWLVYYRKKSGGGPDRQRWEQLKRFLGAGRWQLEPILDDVLPSLLQLGLITFCASLILYLRHLSPAISLIVGIPMSVGLGFFVGSALCAIWDKFCPFQSPLSHVLVWSARTMPSALKTIQALRWEQLGRGFSIKRWIETLSQGREEESPGSLQVIALRRAICTSDDPATLLNATANIFSIKDVARMEELWTDPIFRERFHDQLRTSYPRMLQLRGRDQVNIATAAQRLYATASVHILLYRNTRMTLPSLSRWLRPVRGKSFLTPDLQTPECSTCLLRGTLTLTVLQACVEKPSQETFTGFCNYVFACSRNWERQDWRLFCVLSLITSNLPDWQNISRESVREAYRGETAHETIPEGLEFLVTSETPKRGPLVTNMLQWANHIILAEGRREEFPIEQMFSVLERFERILRNHQLPGEARQRIREMRRLVSQRWQEECAAAARGRGLIPVTWPDLLERYIANMKTIHQGESGYDECIDICRVFSRSTRQFMSDGYGDSYVTAEAERRRLVLFNTFNDFVLGVHHTSLQIQNTARRVRDPDGRWCHQEEKRVSIWAIYSLPLDLIDLDPTGQRPRRGWGLPGPRIRSHA